MKKAIVIGGIILIGLLFYYMYINFAVPEYEPTYTIIELKSDTLNESVYLKKKVWGIAANHEVFVVSKSNQSEFEPTAAEEYVYTIGGPFLYKFENDTLKVYVNKVSEVPPNFSSKIKIEQVVLSNPEMMNLLDEYEERGVKLFSR